MEDRSRAEGNRRERNGREIERVMKVVGAITGQPASYTLSMPGGCDAPGDNLISTRIDL